jgi:phage baseplate assembly protein W
MDYLALPLVLREGYLDRTDLSESLVFSVGLLLSTRVGTLPFDRGYGCEIWEREYSDLLTANKADIRGGLRNAIDKYEKRLYNVSVSFGGAEDRSPHTLGMVVRVTGNYMDGTEEKKFEAGYQLG